MDRGFIDLMILSGSDIKRGSLFGADKKIAVVWVDPKNKHCTKPALKEGSAPEWNYKFMLPLIDGVRTLTIEIHSKGSFGDPILGTVHIPVADIPLDGQRGANKKLTFLVEQPSGRRHGSLNVFAKIVNSQTYAGYPSANSNVVTPPPEKIYSHATSQSNLGSGPSLYPPVESHYTERPYPPAQNVYPPQYPPLEPAFDYSRPTYPPYEPVSNRPPSSNVSVYPPSAPNYDYHRPTLSSHPDRHEYPVSTYPPADPYAYPPAGSDYPLTAYPPAGSDYSAAAYPPSAPCYPPAQCHTSQHQSYSPKYPPICGTYP